MIVSYGAMVGASILLLIAYNLLIRDKGRWMYVLFVSVTVANLGYLLEAVTKSHTVAILANDLAYLGAIAVMLSTLILIKKLCGFSQSKLSLIILIALAAGMFAIVALHPVIPLYYRDTWLETYRGITILKKDYGPLYLLYRLYIISYLAAMIAFICLSIKKHRIHSVKIATLLFLVATINIAVWRIQKWIGTPFNLLSVSYICGAFILFYLFWLMRDYVNENSITSPEPVVIEKVVYVARSSSEGGWSADRVAGVLSELGKSIRLTDTETRVLVMLLDELPRKEISLRLSVSENTIKSHISHIYAKLGIGSKEELRALFARESAEV